MRVEGPRILEINLTVTFVKSVGHVLSTPLLARTLFLSRVAASRV